MALFEFLHQRKLFRESAIKRAEALFNISFSSATLLSLFSSSEFLSDLVSLVSLIAKYHYALAEAGEPISPWWIYQPPSLLLLHE
jgi:hypothetical protein